MTFRLEDALGRPLAQTEQPLDTQPAEAADGQPSGDSPDGSTPLMGVARWKPPIAGPGFYRVRAFARAKKPRAAARCPSSKSPWRSSSRSSPTPAASSAGACRRRPPAAAAATCSACLRQAGVRWVKYPLWYDADGKDAAIEPLIAFVEQLNEQGIDVVGLLSAPPPSVQKHFGHANPMAAAELFAPPPKVWYPSLEAVMGRLATQVRWWQLGTDKDTSFMGYPGLARKIAEVKKELDRIGYDVGVGMGWTWQTPLPQAGKPPARGGSSRSRPTGR